MGGVSFGALGGLSGSGFSYFASNHPLKNFNDDGSPMDGDALVDPNHPGHREAIKTISHVDGDTHNKFTGWLKGQIHKAEHGDSDVQN
jgi:hypothetical protein